MALISVTTKFIAVKIAIWELLMVNTNAEKLYATPMPHLEIHATPMPHQVLISKIFSYIQLFLYILILRSILHISL
jgi:hypothetical protein